MRSTFTPCRRSGLQAKVALLALSLFAIMGGARAADDEADKALSAFQTNDFYVILQKSSQTLVSLAPISAGGKFDFAPSDRFMNRLGDGNYRLGDLDLRIRQSGETAWHDYSSAYKRIPVKALATGGAVLAAADISGTMGYSDRLRIVRCWEMVEGRLALRFTLTNSGDRAIEIGGLGLPMIFDNIISGRTLDEAHEKASFYDPYVGRDGGYLQVTRLNGEGPALLVLPERNTPFELYKPILDQRDRDGSVRIYSDAEPRNNTFEGFYDWMVASKGFAETEWKGVAQWNEPTSFILGPGESRTVGVRFVLSPSIRAIEQTLADNRQPVAIGVPGYVVPTDMRAKLFLQSAQPVSAIAVSPAGALKHGAARQMAQGWVAYDLVGVTPGRVRLAITYADGSVQTVHYLVTKPEAEVVADMGRFLTTRQWFDDTSDPFHRAPSVMGYDRDENRIITQDDRVWVAGLSDEGGAGSWLAAVMKELNNPAPEEVAKLEAFATKTLWGRIQVAAGADKYGVHKSVFYYDPEHMPPGTYDSNLNWKTWGAWDKNGADDLGRSFNYPHVAAAWWTLYRLARYHHGLATAESWQTYLTRAAETIKAMMTKAPYYTQFGQMEGNVFRAILDDVKREGMSAEAAAVESLMKQRADQWKTLKYPFGSEMPWDSTGQPEVFEWMRYFGYADQAAKTREVILAYDPTIPHWGYNGSARRFWDFQYAGKVRRIERQLHHYGSANSAIPLLEAYRDNPQDFYLLRVAYGGLMGSLTNVDADGFGSAAFHSFPDMMKFDGISGDYGSSFFAHAFSSASYLVRHPVFGWLGFGGDVDEIGKAVVLTPKDSARNRVYIAPAGLWLTLNAGKIASVRYEPETGEVVLVLPPGNESTPMAYLDVSVTARNAKSYRIVSQTGVERGLYAIALQPASEVKVVLRPAK